MQDHNRSRIHFKVQPRMIPAEKAARRLHLVLEDFVAKLPALRMEGFPAQCPVTGHFDLLAIDAWLDRRAGLKGLEQIPDHDAIINERLASL